METVEQIQEIIVNRENPTYTIQTRSLDGKKYLVVPVVMMKEGVHVGSRGAVYHQIHELGKFPSAWNGIPVTINHPKDNEGFVSAKSPDIPHVGKVFHTFTDGDKLKAQAWVDEQKILAQSPTALAYIRQGKPLEVSVGVFTDEELITGEWNGENYVAVAKNYRPDHLALLPEDTGACSWNDGCGIRVNVEVHQEETTENQINTNSQEQEVQKMEAKTPCCLAKIEQLMNNKSTRFTEADKEWLLSQDEAVLDKLFPVEQAVVQVNEAQVIQTYKNTLRTADDFIAIMPQEMQESMRTGLTLNKQHRDGLVNTILSGTKDVWTKEDLNEMNVNMLERIAKSIPTSVDYSGQTAGAGIQTNSNEVEILLPNV